METYYNHRWEVICALQAEIAKWVTADPELSPYPLRVQRIFNYWQEPKRLSESDLPAIFYATGSARANDAIVPATNLKGETCTLIIYAVVNALVATPTVDSGWGLEKSVVQRATEMELMIQHLVNDNQHIGGTGPDGDHGTLELRMRRMEPNAEKLSDRETLEFHIEIDHYYPI